MNFISNVELQMHDAIAIPRQNFVCYQFNTASLALVCLIYCLRFLQELFIKTKYFADNETRFNLVPV